MRLADFLVLQNLEPHMSPEAYAIACAAVEKAGGIQQLKDVAVIIELEKAKQSFGGDRSAAGRYAAQVRWGKKTETGGGGGEQTATAASPPQTPDPTDQRVTETISAIDDWEERTQKVYERSGFDATEPTTQIGKAREAVKNAYDMDKAGMPTETVVGTLKKESRRLRTLSTRTNKKGHELQDAMGGQKRDADGKLIMTDANRLFTEARIFQQIANLVDGLVQHFNYRPSRNR